MGRGGGGARGGQVLGSGRHRQLVGAGTITEAQMNTVAHILRGTGTMVQRRVSDGAFGVNFDSERVSPQRIRAAIRKARG